MGRRKGNEKDRDEDTDSIYEDEMQAAEENADEDSIGAEVKKLRKEKEVQDTKMRVMTNEMYKLDEDMTSIKDTMEGLIQSVETLHDCTMGVKNFIEQQNRPQWERNSGNQRIGLMSRGDSTLITSSQGTAAFGDGQPDTDQESWSDTRAENTAQRNENCQVGSQYGRWRV